MNNSSNLFNTTSHNNTSASAKDDMDKSSDRDRLTDHEDLRIQIRPAANQDRHKRDDTEAIPKASTVSLSSPRATLASPEIVDVDLDDVPKKPFPGVDDGFFPSHDEGDRNDDNPDVELVPVDGPGEKEIPDIFPRFGGDGDDADADGDGGDVSDGVEKTLLRGGGVDIEIGGAALPGSIPDVNVYQHKKTLAQGMMDLALLSANANQLRYVLESYDRHPYFYPSLVLIVLSLMLQVAVGIGLIWNAAYNIKDEKEICIANRINNFTVSGIFLVTVVNVFVSAFGVANAPPVK